MRYEDLNGHFRGRIRERVAQKLTEAHPAQPVNYGVCDYVVGVIILIADENNIVRAAERLCDIKQANPETACSLESATATIAVVYERFGTEVSILHDLYQMQENQTDLAEIIAHMEARLLEP